MSKLLTVWLTMTVVSLAATAPLIAAEPHSLRGAIVDSKTGQPLAARVYLQSSEGKWFHAQSADPQGEAVPYSKERGAGSVEVHTAISAHPFHADLPAGKYQLTVERGKEYLPQTLAIEIGEQPVDVKVRLRRWIDMSSHGWYSGETHVHRGLDELPTAMLADDLNVALPLTYWVTQAHTPPTRGDKNAPAADAALIKVDDHHVIYPRNTEYEIFTVGGKRHTLGAIFALNHKKVLDRGVPPVRAIAEQVHAEGGLLELDKHNWPWSMMLIPIAKVDLYELTNNHVWRTEFAFRQFGETPPAYMHIEQDERGMTEKGWLDFTFQNYYALLNCGFRMRPTAGTASGVHPVSLGFGRVYVHLEEPFSYDAWMKGLDAGRSFVTTGPLLEVKLANHWPGSTIVTKPSNVGEYRLHGWARSARPLANIEVVAAGEVVRTIEPDNRPLDDGGFESLVDVTLSTSESTWFAVRCFEPTEDRRVRFAHSAPFHVDVPEMPLRPRRAEVQYLIDRVQSEIERNEGVLGEEAMNEFREALAAYKAIASKAR